MRDAIRAVLQADARLLYAILFGSHARQAAHARSDVDVAIESCARLTNQEIGHLVNALEHASGRRVDVLLLDEAPPAIAYRVFRDGEVLFERDHDALVDRKARAIVEYLDFQPLEQECQRGVLARTRRG